MFEQYHLISIDIPQSINTGNAASAMKNWAAVLHHDSSDADAVMQAGFLNAEFSLIGHAEILPMFLNSDQDTEDALHLQSFSIMNSLYGYYTDREFYNSCMLCYTYEGEGILHYEGAQYTLKPGCGFLIDCRRKQEYFTSADHWQHLDLHFQGKEAELILHHIQQENPVGFFQSSVQSFNSEIEHFLDACTNSSPHRPVYVSSQLVQLMTWVLNRCEETGNAVIPSIYRDLVSYMEANYAAPLSLDELSRKTGVSKYHLSRQFREYYGMPPHEYLISLRILNACLLLKSTDMTIEDISDMTGFNNYANFMRLFKKQKKMTPGEYRKAQ
ncbi:MAG: AraC family transcriptional regulator [Solobacterium sp.]|jgi:AraC-like DNA-binding protein|nr:AraC family transcriptional regulator [Solobacterium sp.]